MKKKTLITIILIVVIIFFVIGYFVFQNINNERKLIDEINKIVELTEKEEMDEVEINKLLERKVTSNDYLKVEVAAKEYMRDSIENINVLYDILNDEELVMILSVENYKSDGPEFRDSLEYISETKEELENAKNTYYEFLTDDVIMSYLDTEDLSEYYIELYKNDVIGDVEIERKDNSIEDSVNDIINMLDIYESVLEFLTKNKNYWVVNGENIIFDTNELLDEYNKLIDNLKEL